MSKLFCTTSKRARARERHAVRQREPSRPRSPPPHHGVAFAASWPFERSHSGSRPLLAPTTSLDRARARPARSTRQSAVARPAHFARRPARRQPARRRAREHPPCTGQGCPRRRAGASPLSPPRPPPPPPPPDPGRSADSVALQPAGARSFEPEFLALLRLAVLRMSLWDRGATYGSTLQNLRYRNEGRHHKGCASSFPSS